MSKNQSVLLTTSGLYIRDPGHLSLFANMDIARKTHFIAMYLIIYGILIRLYYSYVSRDYRELLFRLREVKGFPAGWDVIKSIITGYFPAGEKMQPEADDTGPGPAFPA